MANLIPVQVTGNIGTIEDNLDAVELSIREKVQEYTAVVVTEDTIKDGKKFLADIRKEKKALDDERKAIKSQWMAPYEEFEKRAKRIIGLYDEPVRIINTQLAEFEEQRRAVKRQEIAAAYDSVKGELADWLPLDKIYNPKWENATYSAKKIREDMELIFGQMKVSISTIKSMESEFEQDALRVLKETGSLQSAVAKINELQKQKERFMEQARAEAEREQQEKERVAREKEQEEAEKRRATEEAEAAELSEKAEAAEKKEVAKEKDILGETERKEAESGSSQREEDIMPDAPFALEKMLTVMVKVGENDLQMLKEFLEKTGLEYEVM